MPIEDNISLLNQLLIKLVKLLEWVVKSIIINPILIILHKFYYALYMWGSIPIKELLFQRVLGMILVVLIFTPILSNIFVMLGQSWLNVYIFIICISIINDNEYDIQKYKYINNINLVSIILKLESDLVIITGYRNKISMFSILIKKSINLIKNHNSKVNKYPYYINYICSSLTISLIGKSKNKKKDMVESFNDVMSSKEIIDYWSEINHYKMIKMKVKFIRSRVYEPFFFRFFRIIKMNCIDHNLRFLGSLIYYMEYQDEYEISELDLVNLRIVKKFIYLSLKLTLFYLWNVLKLIGVEGDIINRFKIEDDPYYKLIYEDIPYIDNDGYILWSEENKIKAGRIIKNIDFYKYSEFYEQLYLYGYVWEFYYCGNVGVNYNKYKHINKFVDIFKNLNKIYHHTRWSEIDTIRARLGFGNDKLVYIEKNFKNDKYVYMDLMEIRCILINEWREHSKDLSLENFYEKNYEVLREINAFVNSMYNVNE